MIGFVFAFVGRAQAQQAGVVTGSAVPTDNDLRAAYCYAVAKAGVALLQEIISAHPNDTDANAAMLPAITKANDNLSRLHAYLAPRIAQMSDVSALLVAGARARADMDETEKVPPCPFTPATAFEACDKAMVDMWPAMTRVRACNNLSWLPF